MPGQIAPTPMAPTNRRIRELAEEAVDCIQVNELTTEEAYKYLSGFLREVIEEALVGKKHRKRRHRRGG